MSSKLYLKMMSSLAIAFVIIFMLLNGVFGASLSDVNFHNLPYFTHKLNFISLSGSPLVEYRFVNFIIPAIMFSFVFFIINSLGMNKWFNVLMLSFFGSSAVVVYAAFASNFAFLPFMLQLFIIYLLFYNVIFEGNSKFKTLLAGFLTGISFFIFGPFTAAFIFAIMVSLIFVHYNTIENIFDLRFSLFLGSFTLTFILLISFFVANGDINQFIQKYSFENLAISSIGIAQILSVLIIGLLPLLPFILSAIFCSYKPDNDEVDTLPNLKVLALFWMLFSTIFYIITFDFSFLINTTFGASLLVASRFENLFKKPLNVLEELFLRVSFISIIAFSFAFISFFLFFDYFNSYFSFIKLNSLIIDAAKNHTFIVEAVLSAISIFIYAIGLLFSISLAKNSYRQAFLPLVYGSIIFSIIISTSYINLVEYSKPAAKTVKMLDEASKSKTVKNQAAKTSKPAKATSAKQLKK